MIQNLKYRAFVRKKAKAKNLEPFFFIIDRHGRPVIPVKSNSITAIALAKYLMPKARLEERTDFMIEQNITSSFLN